MFAKVKEKLNLIKTKVGKKAGIALMAVGVVGTLVCGNAQVFATDGTGTTITAGSLDFSPIADSVLSVISMTDIITIIAATIGAGAIFILGWFGVRKIISALKKAIFKGKFGV